MCIRDSFITVGSNIQLGNAGVITATSFSGDGSALTGIDATKIITGNTQVQTVDTGSDGHIKFTTEGNERVRIDSSGHILPAADSTYNIGSNSVRFANGYFDTLYGSGANLTSLPAAQLSGTAAAINGSNITNLNGSAIATGTVAADRIAGLPGNKITSGTVDAARIPTLNQNTTGNAQTATTSGYLTNVDNRTVEPDDDSTNRMRFGFGSYANNNSSPYADYLHLNSYGDASGGNPSLVMWKRGGYGMRQFSQSWNSSSAYSTYAEFFHNRDNVLPQASNTYDLGSSSYRWRDIYTNDLNLSNEGGKNDVDGSWGSYTIQEGESDLFLINKRSGKKFKFMLQEVL